MRILLLPLSFIFRIIVFFRNKLYDFRILKRVKLKTKVISVGNIASGGTGKTPLVELIARYVTSKDKFAVIIQKGYKRESDELKVTEFDFKNEKNQLNSENFGDEGLLLLENLNNIKNGRGLLIVCDNKTSAAKFADTKYKPDVIIVDDGFQHRKLDRNLDIVIVSESKNNHVIPAGDMREPASSVFRADVIVINNKFSDDMFVTKTKHKPKVSCGYEFEGIKNLNGEIVSQPELSATVFCGIADPDSFRLLLDTQKIKVGNFLEFPDHHSFTIDDIRRITENYKKNGSNSIITTQKDFVRIKNSELVLNSKGSNIYKDLLLNYPLYYAKIKMQISNNEELLFDKIDELFR